MKMAVQFLGFSAIALMFVGCISNEVANSNTPERYTIQIDAIGAHARGAANYNYVFIPGNESITTDDLVFRELSQYLEIPLIIKGYRRVSNEQTATFGMRLTYSVSEPIHNEETIQVPIMSQVGVTTTETVTTDGDSRRGGGARTTTVVHEPQYDVTGYRTEQRLFFTYRHTMILEAIDLQAYRESGRVITHWKTIATSTSTSDDLRAVFPALVISSWEYFGESTRGVKTVSSPSSMRTIDRRFEALKNRRIEDRSR